MYDVVFRNSATLTLLNMDTEQSFRLKQPVVFHNLRDLECSLMDADEAAACPRLEKLSTRIPVKVLQKLPAETLTSLRIISLAFGSGSHEAIEQLVSALSRLTRLKSLILVNGLRSFLPRQWTDLHDRAFSRLFTNMKELEEVGIAFTLLYRVNVDSAIETLVHNCPSVRSIRMEDAVMTDASFRSLSRLTGLQHLDIGSSRKGNGITTAGILSLLRGGSRNVLRDLKLKVSVLPDKAQILAEGQLLQQETGRSLLIIDAESGAGDDDLHNFSIAI